MTSVTISIKEYAGSFAENKDVAKDIRTLQLLPTLEGGGKLTFDYMGVDNTTQSFTHALISEGIRLFGDRFFELVSFKNCNEDVQRVIGIVCEYMQRRLA